MNRQYCILVYSKNSPACQKLFEYLESLPFDLMNTTGMTPCCADNKTMRDTLTKVGVETVPTLMTKYFNNAQQQLCGDDIYNWISEVASIMGYAENTQEEEQTSLPSTPSTKQEEEQLTPTFEPEEAQKPRGGGGSLLTQALSMQKSRDNDMSTKKVPQQE